MSAKPHAPACERNKAPILTVLRRHLHVPARVLEVGSGTGQHAVHFASACPALCWQCSDLPENLPGIGLWLEEAGLPNTPPAMAFDVGMPTPSGVWDAVFTANTLHIMGWPEVQKLFDHVAQLLRPGGMLIIYGPFRYGGAHVSPSNADFDRWLKVQAPHRGVRDFEAVNALGQARGLALVEDHAMPANNRCIVWRMTDTVGGHTGDGDGQEGRA